MNDNAKKWVAALRSGKYKQTIGVLTELGKTGEIIGHCCLGVACELYLQAGNKIRVQSLTDEAISAGRTILLYGDFPKTLPSVVRTWLGLRTSSGSYAETCLTSKNDNDSSFSEIADIIESEPEGLFE